MSKNNFILIVVAALIAAALAWWVSSSQKPSDSGLTGQLLFPDLAEQINNVNRISLIGPGNRTVVTMERSDEFWGVQEREGFRANLPQVKSLLAAMAQTSIVENKTKREQYFSRLGVENITSVDAQGFMVRLDDRDDLSLIIGHPAPGGVGRYVRFYNGEQAYLVDEYLELAPDPLHWIDSDVLTFDANRVQEMYVRHGDGEVIHAGRDGGEENEFVLRNTPEGREVSSPWTVNSYPSTISSVVAEDVRRANGDIAADAISALFITNNGLNLQLEMYQEGEAHWLRVAANAEPASAVAADALAESQEDAELIDPVSEAEMINQRLGGWEYKIAEFKYNSWGKRMDDLLAPLEGADEANDAEEAVDTMPLAPVGGV